MTWLTLKTVMSDLFHEKECRKQCQWENGGIMELLTWLIVVSHGLYEAAEKLKKLEKFDAFSIQREQNRSYGRLIRECDIRFYKSWWQCMNHRCYQHIHSVCIYYSGRTPCNGSRDYYDGGNYWCWQAVLIAKQSLSRTIFIKRYLD